MNSWRLVYRNLLVYRRGWVVFLTGFLEPLLYLFSIGVGVGAMVRHVEVNGVAIDYTVFVAPALLASAAMNGAIMDSTFNLFFKLRYQKLYDTVLATPMTTADIAIGETTWSLLRAGIYSAGFLLIMTGMGLVPSWWAVLAWPATLLIGFAFAGVGMALTTYLRSWQDFEFLTLALMPMLLFSGTFFPVDALGIWGRWLVEVTPLYRGVVLCRELVTGQIGMASLVSLGYLVVLGLLGMLATRRRLERLLRH